jgi:hypothetical protein
MSRGLGRVQRRIIEVLQGDQGMPTMLLAAMVYMDETDLAEFQKFDRDIQLMTCGMRPPANDQRTAVRRACTQLWRAGRIIAYDLKPNFTVWAIKP